MKWFMGWKMQTRSKACLSFFFFSYAFTGYAQDSSCNDLIREYDSGAYKQVVDYVVTYKESVTDGCYFNIAGLSVFKMQDSNQLENRNLGLWFFAKSADLRYPAGGYNLYKYTYLNTDTQLATILDGLTHLIGSSNVEKWRSSSLKSISLGNQIIKECGGVILDSKCRGRVVTRDEKQKFESASQQALNVVKDDIPRRNMEVMDSQAFINTLILGLGIGLAFNPSILLRTPPTPPPQTYQPWLYQTPPVP